MSTNLSNLRGALARVHVELRDAIVNRCRELSCDQLARVATDLGEGDETFEIDIAAEEILPELLERELAPLGTSVVVLFEGQQTGPLTIPRGTPEHDCEFRSIWDPLDGSRMLAYQLHSGWILTGVAPNRGESTRLSDAILALQTEVPLLNQRESAVLTASRSAEAGNNRAICHAELVDTQSGVTRPLSLRPSSATTLERGFVAHESYFEGPAVLLARFEEQVLQRALGPTPAGAARVWRDAQITSAGTLFNLLSGKVRWAHDVRPLMRPSLESAGEAMTLCAHPYDLCTAPLLCEALGVILTDPLGKPFDAPMSVTDDVAWCGYANQRLAESLIPIVREVLGQMTNDQNDQSIDE